MPYATYRFNKIIAAETIRFIVTVAIVVYKGLKLVVYRMLTFHELVPLNEGLLMKVVGITLIVYHTDLALVFRHEHVNITIQWITMVSTTDYLTYTLSLASHVVKFRKIIEVMQSVYT